MKELSDKRIIESWKKNTLPWVAAVREGKIESRLQVTNQAIIDVIVDKNPETLFDIGCGEGWLIRALSNTGVRSLGIDVVPELIKAASEAGGGRFKSMEFETLAYDSLGEQFDLIVCNFSLLGKTSVEHVFRQVPSFIKPGGWFIIQTIHPLTGCGDEVYRDGWREGSWAGLDKAFSDPAPWYFRTLETWKAMFIEYGFTVEEIVEPLHPVTEVPASIIFIARVTN